LEPRENDINLISNYHNFAARCAISKKYFNYMLSKKSQYALYALIRLARDYPKGPVLISTIAREEKIPQKFLEAILLETKKLGITNSKKGKGGGYYLILPPEKINLAFIIRNFEGAMALLPCAALVFYESCTQCRDESSCGLRGILKELRDATEAYLRNVSLADVIQKENHLIKIIQQQN
jgi:Rrf2 family protein